MEYVDSTTHRAIAAIAQYRQSIIMYVQVGCLSVAHKSTMCIHKYVLSYMYIMVHT